MHFRVTALRAFSQHPKTFLMFPFSMSMIEDDMKRKKTKEAEKAKEKEKK